MSWEEYRSGRHSFPYVVRVGRLLMFGARHTSDPRDPELVELERLWREFRPEVAFSEGGIRPSSAGRDEAIARYGEPGLVRWLADRDGAELRNLEPPRIQEEAEMKRRFPPEQVNVFYYLRPLIVEGGQRTAESEELARRVLPAYAGVSRPEWFDPTRDDTVLNMIARAASDYRNCHMVPLVTAAARSGRRVFVVVGGSHVVVQERAIRTALDGR